MALALGRSAEGEVFGGRDLKHEVGLDPYIAFAEKYMQPESPGGHSLSRRDHSASGYGRLAISFVDAFGYLSAMANAVRPSEVLCDLFTQTLMRDLDMTDDRETSR